MMNPMTESSRVRPSRQSNSIRQLAPPGTGVGGQPDKKAGLFSHEQRPDQPPVVRRGRQVLTGVLDLAGGHCQQLGHLPRQKMSAGYGPQRRAHALERVTPEKPLGHGPGQRRVQHRPASPDDRHRRSRAPPAGHRPLDLRRAQAGQAEPGKSIGDKKPYDGSVRGPRSRLPLVVRPDEASQQLADRPTHPGAVQRRLVDREAFDEIASALLGGLGGRVHREGTLNTPASLRVIRDHDPDLPHPRLAFPDRPRTPGPGLAIPITLVHPYRYRDRYRDDALQQTSLMRPEIGRDLRLCSARSEGLEPPTF